MRTTIDLPDRLYRRVKARAAMRGMKLKNLIASLLERGLKDGMGEAASGSNGMAGDREEDRFPLIRGKCGSLMKRLDNALIADLEAQEEAGRVDEPPRR